MKRIWRKYRFLLFAVIAINLIAVAVLLLQPKHPLHSYTEIPFGLEFGDTWEEVCEKLHDSEWTAVSQISGYTGHDTTEDVIALYLATEEAVARFDRIYLRFDLIKEKDLASDFELMEQDDELQRMLYRVEIYPNASADQWEEFATVYSEAHPQGAVSDSYSKGNLWNRTYSAKEIVSDRTSRYERELRDKVSGFHALYSVEKRFYSIDVMTEGNELSIVHDARGHALYEYVDRRSKREQKNQTLELSGNSVEFAEIDPEYTELTLPSYQASWRMYSPTEYGQRLKNAEAWKNVRRVEYPDENKVVYYFEDGSEMVENENGFLYGKSGYDSSSDTNDLYREVRENGYFLEGAEDAFAPQDLTFMSLAEANELVSFQLEIFGMELSEDWKVWALTKKGMDRYAEEDYQQMIQIMPDAEKMVFTEADEAYLYEIPLTLGGYPIDGDDASRVQVTIKESEIYKLEIINVYRTMKVSEPQKILTGECAIDWYRQKHSYWLEDKDILNLVCDRLCYVPIEHEEGDANSYELIPAYCLLVTNAEGREWEVFVNAITGEDLR